jgi:hypothetical protein
MLSGEFVFNDHEESRVDWVWWCNPSTWKGEVGGSQVPDQLGLQGERERQRETDRETER